MYVCMYHLAVDARDSSCSNANQSTHRSTIDIYISNPMHPRLSLVSWGYNPFSIPTPLVRVKS